MCPNLCCVVLNVVGIERGAQEESDLHFVVMQKGREWLV